MAQNHMVQNHIMAQNHMLQNHMAQNHMLEKHMMNVCAPPPSLPSSQRRGMGKENGSGWIREGEGTCWRFRSSSN